MNRPRMLLDILLLPFSVVAAADWPLRPPGRPANLTATVSSSHVALEWVHASPDNGLATHYVVKWVGKDQAEAEWYQNWVGVGEERIEIRQLVPGAHYAVRVAAVNPQGRTWSKAVVFSTLAWVRCDETFHWRGVLDDADVRGLCGPGADRVNSADPDGIACGDVGTTEYILAGLAAGSAISLIGIAILLRHRCFPDLCGFSEPPEPRSEAPAYMLGGGRRGGGGGPSSETVELAPAAHHATSTSTLSTPRSACTSSCGGGTATGPGIAKRSGFGD